MQIYKAKLKLSVECQEVGDVRSNEDNRDSITLKE